MMAPTNGTTRPPTGQRASAAYPTKAPQTNKPAAPQRGPRRPAPPSSTQTLVEEFAAVPRDVVERIVAAARHVLERSRMVATPDAVTQLAREHLRIRVAARHRHPHGRAG
jgi:hypothetical protein